jgi:potassium/hydrogen antiporter
LTDTTLVFAVVAAIIIIGYAGESLFRKTGVPAFVFLIFTGIVLGPILHVFPVASLIPALAIFAELTLLMVLFYAGTDTKLASVLRGGGRAFLQVIIYVGASTFLIGLFVLFVLKWDIIESFIFASMVGGETTAAVVVPLSRALKLPDVTVAFLTLESAMNSIFSIVLFFAFVGIYDTGTGDVLSALSKIAANFSVGIVLGLILGVGGVVALNRFQARKYTYVLTVGVIFLTYSVTEELGGSGELAVLIFGLILGNYYVLNSVMKTPLDMDPLRKQLGTFQDEISFLMETLFFVFLGLTFAISAGQIVDNFVTGAAIVAILLSVRYVATSASTFHSELSKEKRGIILMCAQGLVPATLAILALDLQIPLANSFLNIVTYVIILTNVVTAGGSIISLRRKKEGPGDLAQEIDETKGKLT